MQTGGSGTETAPFVSLGGVSPGVKIRICAHNGAVLNELQIGRFQIRGACVMPGYHNNPEANAECLLDEQWLDSGDLGFVHRGELVLTGRAKEMIILRGANYYCYEVEGVVGGVEGVAPTRVAATSVRDEREGTEVLLLFFVPAGAMGEAPVRLLHEHGVLLTPLRELVAAARAQLSASLGLTARYAIPVSAEAFLVTTSGKIQRTAFQKAFLSGTYARATRAIDLALGTSPLAAPDFFAAPAWIRKQPLSTQALGGAVWIAPRGQHDSIRERWAAECSRRQTAPALALVDTTDGWEGVGGAIDKSVTLVVHSLMCCSDDGGETGARAAGGNCSTLCDLARVVASRGDAFLEGQFQLLCLRAFPPSAQSQARLAWATAGGALAPGLCKAFALEHAAVRCASLVDVPPDVSHEQLVSVVLTEATGGSALDADVEYRQAPPDSAELGAPTVPAGTDAAPLYRYVKRFCNVGAHLEAEAGQMRNAARVEDVSPAQPPLTPLLGDTGGAFVVTGGLGAIGVALVQLLLKEGGDVRVIIIGRRPRTAAQAQLEALGWAGAGSRVMYAEVDLGRSDASYQALLGALQDSLASATVGGARTELRGVLHLAGAYERAPLAQLTAQTLHAATCAKMLGAQHLHRACLELGARPVFLHFGSTASVFSGAGLGAYAGANASLEWFAAWQRDQGVRSRALVWTAWSAGISSRDKSLGFAKWVSRMSLLEGVRILHALLETSLGEAAHPDVLIGVNMREPSLGALFADGPVSPLTPCLFHTRDEVPTAEQCGGQLLLCVAEWPRVADQGVYIDVEALRTRPIPVLLGASEVVPARGPTEQTVAAVFAECLGLQLAGLDRQANFFDAGGSSIMWMRAVSRLNAAFGLKLAAMEIFGQAVLADLAAHVDALKASGGGMGWQPSRCIELLAGEDTGARGAAVFLLPAATGTAVRLNPKP